MHAFRLIVLMFAVVVAGQDQVVGQDATSEFVNDSDKQLSRELTDFKLENSINQQILTTSPSTYFSISADLPTPESANRKIPREDIVNLIHSQSEVQHDRHHCIFCYSDGFAYRRLLFEEPQLERCGQSKPEFRQIMNSGTKFFVRGAVLPLAVPFRRTFDFEGCK